MAELAAENEVVCIDDVCKTKKEWDEEERGYTFTARDGALIHNQMVTIVPFF